MRASAATNAFLRWGLRILLATLAFVCVHGSADAQSRRDPTPEEKQVLMKPVGVMRDVMDTFLGTHDMEADPAAGTPGEDLSVPIEGSISTAFEWECTVRKDSDRYNLHIKPVLDKIEQAMQSGQYDQVKSLRQEIKKWSRLHVSVELNSAVLGFGSAPKKDTVLSVPGAAKAFVVAEDNEAPDNRGNTILAFGDWKNATRDEANNVDRFPFARPAQSPYVENMVVTISGAEDLVHELIDQADWTKVAASLTP